MICSRQSAGRVSRDWKPGSIETETILEPLKNFILPGGCSASAGLHVARTVCRRAERHLATLMRENPVMTKDILDIPQPVVRPAVCFGTIRKQANREADVIWRNR